MRILVVEDDPEVAETLMMAFAIRWPDAEVAIRERGDEGLRALEEGGHDVITLDVNLPDQSGFSVLESIRKTSNIPVIMLTVRAAEAERVRGLEMGADDYVAKPFSPFEVLARVAAVLRRYQGDGEEEPDQNLLQAGPITVNMDSREVTVDGELVKLSPTEFRILSLLMQSPGKVVSRDTLIHEIWGMDPAAADRYLVKLHMQHLRKKLGDNGAKPRMIITVRGFGYKVAT